MIKHSAAAVSPTQKITPDYLLTSGRRSLHENSLPLPEKRKADLKIFEKDDDENHPDLSCRSPLKGSNPLLIKLDNAKFAGDGFDTFRKGSPDFRHANLLQDNNGGEEEEEKNNVYNSPLFMKKSLMASLKKSLQSLNLIAGGSQSKNGGVMNNNETRRSSPEKLSPSKFSAKLIEKRESEDRSFRLQGLEMLER